ncbi:MAG: phosphoglycerate kinase [Candidatus Dadabacteria bacterium]|nr:phosphoglycerate kinase [Candidatus Dadabacteria bacterium]NIT13929.1 phosphoglycerate kinase [Candidatus Dadabacteria bacterium]
MRKLFIDDLPDIFYKGKRVLIRVDYNVPIKNGMIREDYRIRQTIPTIEYLSNKGAKIILISHLGRPCGVRDPRLSLKPIADRLLEVLNVRDVQFVDECIGKHVSYLASRLEDGEVLLLENMRFYKEEQENEPQFCKLFSDLADIYVNDAFSSSHRMHASTYGIPKLFDHRLGGFLVKKEIQNLNKIIKEPKRPFLCIVGGSKLKEKIAAINSLVRHTDKIMIGGCTANPFLVAEGRSVGDSIVESDYADQAKAILKEFGDRIMLPDDFLIQTCDDTNNLKNVYHEVHIGQKVMDIGKDTTYYYCHQILNNKGTIFWSGPMGQFEVDEYARGTNEIARSLSYAHWRGAHTVIGGGDTIAAIRNADVLLNEIDFVSTGGSATLNYLAGIDLPGISILSEGVVPKKNIININYRGEAVCL